MITLSVKFNYSTKDFPANWDKEGKKAGILRNVEMIKEKPDYVIAYTVDIKASRGTNHMISLTLKHEIPAYLNMQDYLDIFFQAPIQESDL